MSGQGIETDIGFEWSPELVERLRTADTGDTPRVYLAGPVYDYNNHRQKRDSVIERAENRDEFELVEPLHRDVENRSDVPESDVDTLATCDAVLFMHVPGCESWGSPAEVYLGAMADYPVVLWETEDSIPGLSVWLESAVDREHLFIDRAFRSCLELTG